MSPPRVLVVDDDASIRRFMALALEDEPIELLCAAGVLEAEALLRREGPVAVVVTDLMMPGLSGMDLLQRAKADPGLLGHARVCVLSAGFDGPTRQRLMEMGAWRLAVKPISVADLQQCVRAALREGPAGAAEPGAGPAPVPAAACGLTPPAREAIDRHFGGEAALYTAFREACIQQFPSDAATGRQARLAGDWHALRLLAHSLKSVFRLLGHADAAAAAERLEAACAQGAEGGQAAGAQWSAVEAHLHSLGGRPPFPS